jgi:flagellar hook-associated protein 3 FlgL
MDTIVNGDAAGRAGVKQMIAERRAADYGTAGSLGRVTRGGGGTTASLTEDGAHPFGFKLTAASSTSPGITTGFAAGPPASVNFNVAANPTAGEEVRVELTMPGGSTQVVKLVATAPPMLPPANTGGFEIGATPAATAANLRAALSAALDSQADSTLSAASALAASEAFFSGNETTPPLRVVGPPATATSLAAGTPANTVIWYKGDSTSTNPRATAQAKIDTSMTVNVGAQANELGIRRMMASLAVFTTETFNFASPADKGRHQAMSDLLRAELSDSGTQTVADIHMEVGLAQATMKRTDERHRTKLAFVEDSIAGVENVNKEEAAAKLLAMQTKMQAAYQTTSIISRLNLTDYLR